MPAKAKDPPQDEMSQEEVSPDEVPSEGNDFLKAEAEAASAQSPGEPQVVPEQRPQAFISPTGGDSAAGKRLAKAGKAMGQEAYDRAKKGAKGESEGRFHRLYPGQRVQILPPNDEAGRMAFVQAAQYSDAVQELIANSGTAEAPFAEVESYIVQTRDGRSDLLVVPVDELTTLEPLQGWGRGQI
jgi:hypothetical protein